MPLSILAMLVPVVMAADVNSQGKNCGAGGSGVVGGLAAADSAEIEQIANECDGLRLVACIANDAQGNKSTISPEFVNSIVLLAKETGCSAVRILGAVEDQSVAEDLQKEAMKAQMVVAGDSADVEHIDLGASGELPTAQQAVMQLQSAIARGKRAVALDLPVDAQGKAQEKSLQVLRRLGGWMSVNGESVCRVQTVDLELPEGWTATVGPNENTYLLPPVMHPNEDVLLKIPAQLIDTVVPVVLGQPEQQVRVKRVEEPGEDEPRAFMQFTIPTAVWDQAVEGMPVIKLINAQ